MQRLLRVNHSIGCRPGDPHMRSARSGRRMQDPYHMQNSGSAKRAHSALRAPPRDPRRAIRAATPPVRAPTPPVRAPTPPVRAPTVREGFLSPARESLDRNPHSGSASKPLADARGSVPAPRDPHRAIRAAPPRDPSLAALSAPPRAIRAATPPVRAPTVREGFLRPAPESLDRNPHSGSARKPLADARGSVPAIRAATPPVRAPTVREGFLRPAPESLDRSAHSRSARKPLADARGSVPSPREPRDPRCAAAPSEPRRAIRSAPRHPSPDPACPSPDRKGGVSSPRARIPRPQPTLRLGQ
ncbi:MAG: hypothetical protein CHACPFDD_01228 [Phycisphaerae bacterium]|nr:hypothetical protein [Phycisphaerae bacterium]